MRERESSRPKSAIKRLARPRFLGTFVVTADNAPLKTRPDKDNKGLP
jgi:hypothetical protein